MSAATTSNRPWTFHEVPFAGAGYYSKSPSQCQGPGVGLPSSASKCAAGGSPASADPSKPLITNSSASAGVEGAAWRESPSFGDSVPPTNNQPSTTPNPPTDNQLLALFLTGDIQLIDIANHFNITARQLIDWSRQAHIIALLDDLRETDLRRAESIAASHKPAAHDVLGRALQGPSTESARKAAGQLLKGMRPNAPRPVEPRTRAEPKRRNRSPRVPNNPPRRITQGPRMRSHRPLFTIAMALVAIVVITLTPRATSTQPDSTPPAKPVADRAHKWREDIDAAVTGVIERHKNAFHTVTRDDLIAAADELKASVEIKTDTQLFIGLMQVIAKVGDAHTMVALGKARLPLHQLPVDFQWLADGLFIVAADDAHAHLLGAHITAIGSTPIDEAAKRVGSLVAHENDQWLKFMTRQWLRVTEVLEATGITTTPESAALTLTLKSGEAQDLTLAGFSAMTPPRLKSPWDADPTALPLSRQARSGNRLYGHHLDPATGQLYCWYDSCTDQPKQPTVMAWSAEVLKLIDDGHAKSLVIDLRRNGGGNSALLMPLIDGLARREKINQPGKLFVLIGQHTFSSGMMNAGELRAATNAKLVGTPTGGKPNSYGEVKTFTLPHSRLTVQYSTKFWRRAANGEDPPSLMPDITADTSSEVFFSGRDAAMEAVKAATTP